MADPADDISGNPVWDELADFYRKSRLGALEKSSIAEVAGLVVD